MFLAIATGDASRVVDFEARHPQLGYSPLHCAVDFDKEAAVASLLRHGADVNSKVSRGRQTPLHLAAQADKAHLVDLLLAHGADATICDLSGKRAYELTNDAVLRDRLKDVPSKIDDCRVDFVETRQCGVSWTVARPEVTRAPTQTYVVTYGQPDRRLENGEYSKTLESYSLATRFEAARTSRISGTKFRHVRRKDRIQLFDVWRVATRRPAHKTLRNEDDASSLIINGLVPATHFTVTVRATNAAGRGAPSPTLSITTSDDAPDPPSEVFLLHSSSEGVLVAWLPPRYENGHPVVEYELQRCIISSAARPRTAPSQESWASYRFKTPATNRFVALTSNDSCLVRIRAKNSVGWSAWSRTSQKFQAVDTLKVLELTARSLVLEWDALSLKATAWEIQKQKYRLRRPPDWTLIADDVPDVRKAIAGLEPGVSYRFRVRAKDFYGWRSWDTAMTTPVVTMPDAPPDACKPPEPHDAGATDVKMTWEPAACNGQPIVEFELQRISVTASWATPWTRSVKEKSCFVDDMTEGAFLFRVRARNKCGWSLWSEPSEPVETNPVPPPSSVRLVDSGATWLKVGWTPATDDVLSFVLQYKNDGSWSTKRTNERELLVGDLKPTLKYIFRIQARTLLGISPFSRESPPFTCQRRY